MQGSSPPSFTAYYAKAWDHCLRLQGRSHRVELAAFLVVSALHLTPWCVLTYALCWLRQQLEVRISVGPLSMETPVDPLYLSWLIHALLGYMAFMLLPLVALVARRICDIGLPYGSWVGAALLVGMAIYALSGGLAHLLWLLFPAVLLTAQSHPNRGPLAAEQQGG